MKRCWDVKDPLYQKYHDEEWGKPVHDDRKLFEMLILEGAQAGLSWSTILKKRENYLQAFDHFVPEIVAGYGEEKVMELLDDPGIVRNKMKINAAISNAKAFLKVQEEYGTFNEYIWQFTGGETLMNEWTSVKEVPVTTPESAAISKDLKKRGFKFVGSTICYSYMQAAGMVNDHLIDCDFREAVTS
ncbi:DNA-3-methyladenine glycosylase I [Bacillus marinisedimentorum]|uniref:DNA-3-methyladenine glycosylase I n=1 Tax=Bacillus marinisedimentorum TaxID=1821260 RepID=UPI001B8046DD|nr:DNA-3-methyladenine glycosylase I [Bacillus marinisedimentorum]